MDAAMFSFEHLLLRMNSDLTEAHSINPD